MKNISFILNCTKNEKEYIKLLLKSLSENLFYKTHEILVFIDSDNENTYEFLQSVKTDFQDFKIIKNLLPHAYGYQGNKNLLVDLAKYDIVSYLQADMVISKNYDKVILENIKPNQILSATRIEPPLHGESAYTFTKDLGLTPETFKYAEFLNYAETVKSDKTSDYFFAPISFYKQTWKKLGGYDTLFRRSREDSDLVQRCLHNGVELTQTFKANVYHFTCVSSRGKDWYNNQNANAVYRQEMQKEADTIELRKFVRKWGSFNHGEKLLTKYDVDLVFPVSYVAEYDFVKLIEPFFSRVWINDHNAVSKVKFEYNKVENYYSNFLLDSEKDWGSTKKYYNLTDYDSIIKCGQPNEWNIRVDFISPNMDAESWQVVQNIHELITQADIGVYECGCFRITIDNKVDISRKTCSNPHFDSFNYEIL